MTNYAPNGSPDCPFNIDYDAWIMTLFGIRYSIDLFKHMGAASIGSKFEIVGRSDGVVTLKSIDLDQVKLMELPINPDRHAAEIWPSIGSRMMFLPGHPFDPITVKNGETIVIEVTLHEGNAAMVSYSLRRE